MLHTLLRRFLQNKETKNAAWLIGGKLAQMLLSFFVGVFTARYLGPGRYGTINYVAAYVAFFTSLCTLGINAVIIKEFTDHPQRQGTAIGTALAMRAVSSALSAVMIFMIILALDGDEPTTLAVAALSSVALLFQIADTFNYWFQSRYQSKVTSIAALAAYAITAAYRIVLLAGKCNVEWFALATSVDHICLAAILVLAYRRHGGPPLRVSMTVAKELLGKSYHYILAGMMVAIYGQTDKMMLKQMLSEEAVGYYSLAFTVNNMWVFVLAAIIDSLTPTIISLYQVDQAGFCRKNRQLYAIVMYLSFAVALGFTLLGTPFIRLIYGQEYLPAAAPLKIICWYTAFSYLGVARNPWIVCLEQQKHVKYITGGAALLNIVLNLLLIPLWGASGAAAASLLTQISTVTVIPWCIQSMRPNVKLMGQALLLRDVYMKKRLDDVPPV